MPPAAFVRIRPLSLIGNGRPSCWCIAALLALAVGGSGPRAGAKASEWKDLQGASFRGEPVEVLGPFGLFKTGVFTGRRMLLRGLTPEDSRRLYQEIAHRAPRAARWADARGEATADAVGRVLWIRDKQLVPADLTTLPEPELLVVLYGSHNDGESWQLVNNYISVHERFARLFAGRVTTVFMGVRHSEAEHRRIATVSNMPWLVADLRAEASMHLLARYAPAEGTLLLLLSREGVPLLSTTPTDIGGVKQFADGLADLLWLMNPANPRTWKDRLQYEAAVRPLAFAHGHGAPRLIGDPLRIDALQQRQVERIDAKIDVAADGQITQVALQPSSVLPDALRAPLADGLRHAVYLPAIDNGVAVAGTADYSLVVPPLDRQVALENLWLSGDVRTELPIKSWLVLKPVKVEEQNFFQVERTDENGMVIAKAFKVSENKVSRSMQQDAFKTDWFAETGAAAVHPHEGDRQSINENVLGWRRVVPKDGLVDFNEGPANTDYSIGYAWTEFESPADIDAWLGLGSDDGVKVWLNGDLIDDKWIQRPSRLDDDIVPLRLKKGPNQLLIKIQNATGAWSFITRIRVRER